jgi:surface protein
MNTYPIPAVEVGSTPEPYVVLTDSNTVMTFYYDGQKATRGGIDINNILQSSTSPYGTATTAVFDVSFDAYRPTSTAFWFQNCASLTTITGIEYLHTEDVTSTEGMFYGCSSLSSLDLSGFNTANVTNMSWMFYGCSGLTSLDLSHFDTQNVTNMGFMFCGCSSLTSLDVSGFKTDNVTKMGCMFFDCSGLTSLDVSSFNTEKVTEMWQMFSDCSGLTSLDVCNFNTEKVTVMFGMFRGCSGLTSLDLSNFNTTNVTDMSYVFYGCSALTTIYVGEGWSTEKVTDSFSMFTNCTTLVGGLGTVYDAEYTDKTYAHIDGGTSNPGYLTLKLAMGDANGDGNINIADAVATVTNILGQPTEAAFYQYAADMNTDQVIDIFDVTLIVNAAFDAASPAPAMTRGSASNIMMEHISMTADADYIYLGIDQPERFTATQFDVTLPEGMELVDARLASATTDHQLSFVKRGDNEYRVIGLSMSNTTFRSMNGQLIKLEVSGSAVDSDVKMSNVLFVTPTATVMTSIDKCLNTAKAADDSFYDLKGQRVSKQQLGKGIYIMNHKKVIIK